MSLKLAVCLFSVFLVNSTTPPPPALARTCRPFLLYANGTSTGVSVARYLDYVSCNSVNSRLMDMYTNTTKGKSIRDEMTKSLDGLCFGFVAMVSMIDLKEHISNDSILSDSKLEGDLCPRLAIDSEENARVSGNLDMLNYPRVSRGLHYLLDLEENECLEKCDRNWDSRIFCNAYYHLAVFFSEVMVPKLVSNKGEGCTFEPGQRWFTRLITCKQ